MLYFGIKLIFLLAGCLFTEDQRPNILVIVADDWSYPHAGYYGDKIVSTPNFDQLAREGVVFSRAYATAPVCTPARSALLTGRYPHNLEAGANLYSYLPEKYPVYPALLEQSGYLVGMSGKGWGPGNFEAGGYDHNPAGKSFVGFDEFLSQNSDKQPFCFWWGSTNPHRPYSPTTTLQNGSTIDDVVVPDWLPDVAEVRQDILDYYSEVEKFDLEIHKLLITLKKYDLEQNTLILVTSDNGMPFPRAKSDLYDAGCRVPLVIYYPSIFPAREDNMNFVNFVDVAPTILSLAKVPIPGEMNGKNLEFLLRNEATDLNMNFTFTERERDGLVRANNLSYPSRSVRTKDYLYILNVRPHLYPLGDGGKNFSGGYVGASPTREYIMINKDHKETGRTFKMIYDKRPEEELYDLRRDSTQMINLISDKAYYKVLLDMRKKMEAWRLETNDPYFLDDAYDLFDRYPYYGSPKK